MPADSTDLVRADFDWRPPAGLNKDERKQAWSRSFNLVYRAGVTAIVTAGAILIEVKRELLHGEWAEWIEGNLPVSQRTANKLMQIAADPNILRYLSNSTHGVEFAPLPHDREILVELCGIEPAQFDGLVESGTIHPEMKRGVARAALSAAAHNAAPPALEELPHGKWRAILADPPWAFETRGSGNDRAPENHYPTMSLTAIELLPVMNIAADDAALFLWVTSDRIKDAPRVMHQWGFELVSTAFVWVKDGPAGLGYWTRKGAEICLLGKRGNPKRLSGGVEEVIRAPRGPHSRKPPEARERIEALVPGPYVELFARDVRAGWDVWGNHPGLGDEDRGDARQAPAAAEPERRRSSRPVTPEEMLNAVRIAVPQRSDGCMPIPAAATDVELDAVIAAHLGEYGSSCGPGRIAESHRGPPRWLICASWAYTIPDNHVGDPLVRTLSGKRAIRAAVREAYGIARP